MTDADRDAKLRERAAALCSCLSNSLHEAWEDCTDCDLIVDALRQTAEEARTAEAWAGCEKCNVSVCQCYLDDAVAAARAEGERAGRKAELFAQIAAAIRARGQRENP